MRVLLLAALLAGVLAGPTAAQITPSTDAPTVGEPLTLTFDAPVDTLTVTFRPGAAASTVRTQHIVLGGQTSYTWTPERAGVVQVAANGATQNLSVRFTSLPGLGVLIMVLAGLILFGGAAWATSLLLQGGHRIDIDPSMRPDT